MEDFAFTIKYVTEAMRNCVPSDYDKVFDTWKSHGCVIDTCVYESDSKNVCHSHGIVRIPKGYLRKKLCRKGLHVKMDKITNRQGWLAYINKHQPKKVNNQSMFSKVVRSEQSSQQSDGDSELSIPSDETHEVMQTIINNNIKLV